MHPAAGGNEREHSIPRLSQAWDPSGHSLSPAEGFLLSRIDGHTSWMQLREIAGIPREQVDQCLERWLAEGIVFVTEVEMNRGPSARMRSAPAREFDKWFESDIDLDEAAQRQILDFERSLDRSYFELLDVERDADDKEIKRAYFRLSKIYHPDRYFRSNIGDFKPRLDRIFHKLVEAYELLSDPTTRSEIERTLNAVPLPAEPKVAREKAVTVIPDSRSDASSDAKPPRERIETPRKLSKRQTLERLRRHFKLPDDVIAERRQQAVGFFKSAMVAAHRDRWSEAAPCIRLAIAFDPWNDEYRNKFAEIQSNYQQERAEQMLDESSDHFDSNDRNEVLRMLEEVLVYRPADAKLNDRVAILAMGGGDREKALEYAEAACEFEPDSAEFHLTYARVLRRFGLAEKALEVLKKASQLDPHDREINAELLDVRRRRRRE